ncbi:MAG: carbohydrate kinase family protein [Thermoprotei archaeon]|jgi:sugar/nucleoside kinase (ribokinase family)
MADLNYDLVVIGDLCLDIDVYYSENIEILGNQREAKKVDISLGGSGSNVARIAKKLGLSVMFISSLSDNPVGNLLKNFVECEIGKENLLLTVHHDNEVYTVISIINKSGARRAIYHIGSKINKYIEKIQDTNPKIFHVSGYALELIDYDEFMTLLNVLSKKNIKIGLDLFPRIKNIQKEYLNSVLEKLTFLFGNVEEYITLTNSQSIKEAVSKLASMKPPIKVIKLGSKGSLAIFEDNVIKEKAFKVKVLSVKGAGDAFIAGFYAAYLKNLPLGLCLQFGNYIASLIISGNQDVISEKLITNIMKV